MVGFEELEISVLATGGDVWVSAQSRLGAVFAVRCRPPNWSRVLGVDGRPSPAGWLRDAVRYARKDGDIATQARSVGRALTDLVFGVPEIGALLQRTRGVAGTSGAQVLVRVLAAPHEVSAWPWELMHDPERPGRCLTMARDVHVVRSGRSRTYPIRQEPVAPPLNLLLVMSSPPKEGSADTETPFDLYAEKRSLLRELRPLEQAGLLRIVVEDRPTVEGLRALMGQQRNGFHLLHYLGHANPSGLKLERPNGRGTLVHSREFAMLLHQLPDLRLAVFAGCETARAPDEEGADDGWAGPVSTADLCVRDASPMVIGMRAVLPFGTERLLTRFFYQALTAGHSVAESLRLARLAIDGDEDCGGPLLNWAVPSLLVGGSTPGPVVDPDADATPVAVRQQVGLRLGVRQGELRFISRLAELREAVDVLSGRTPARLLHVVGMPATGKSALLDRVIEEFDPSIAYLFISSKTLLDKPDPVAMLAELVVEVLEMKGVSTVPRGDRDSSEWWDRVVGGLDKVSLAIVIDDGDLLAGGEPGGKDVLEALGVLTSRRGSARLAVVATQQLEGLTKGMKDSEVRVIRLDPLSWSEVWQWIRRNLPALARFGEADLRRYYDDIRHLEDWERLAGAVSEDDLDRGDDLRELVRRFSVNVVHEAASAPKSGESYGAALRRPLRLAVAGPHTADRHDEIASVVTQCAIAQGVPGRVVVSGATGYGESALGELVPPEQAFHDEATSDADRLLHDVSQAGADIVVVDHGESEQTVDGDALVRVVAVNGKLVVESGDHPDAPMLLGREDGGRTAAGMPYLYAPRTITKEESAAPVLELEGTTCAALYVAVAAMLVWATDRDLAAGEVRDILIASSSPIATGGGTKPGRLSIDRALTATRRKAVERALGGESMQLGQLLAETSVRPELAVPILDDLVAAGAVHQVVRGGVEQFEAAPDLVR